MSKPKTLATLGLFGTLLAQVIWFVVSILMSCGLLLFIGAFARLFVWFFMEGWRVMGSWLA